MTFWDKGGLKLQDTLRALQNISFLTQDKTGYQEQSLDNEHHIQKRISRFPSSPLMLAAGAVKDMRRYWKGKKNGRVQQVLHVVGALERGQGVPGSHRDTCVHGQWLLPFSPFIISWIPACRWNFIQSLCMRSRQKEKEKSRTWDASSGNVRTVVFQLCNNSIIPLLQRGELKSPVVCVILLHTESMILLEAKDCLSTDQQALCKLTCSSPSTALQCDLEWLLKYHQMELH